MLYRALSNALFNKQKLN